METFYCAMKIRYMNKFYILYISSSDPNIVTSYLGS